MLLLSIICLSAFVAWSDDNGQPILIYILDNTVETGTTHRDSAEVPLQGYYDEFTSTVRVFFLLNLGDVDVIVSSLCSSDYDEYEVDSSLGVAVIPVNSGSGIYHITFLLSDGGGYEGEFEVF